MKKKLLKTAAKLGQRIRQVYQVLRRPAVVLLLLIGAASLWYNTDQLKQDYINLSRKSVVTLMNVEETGGGTGFYVKAPNGKKYILTNAHVCRMGGPLGIVISINEARQKIFEIVESVYSEHDLCVLTAPKNAPALNIAKSVRDTENIYVLGHPLLEPLSLVPGQMSGLMTIEMIVGINMECIGPNKHKEEFPEGSLPRFFGVISACYQKFDTNPITANVLPGNSGSPVLNSAREVVGVVFAAREGAGRGYIVPLKEVQKFLGELK